MSWILLAPLAATDSKPNVGYGALAALVVFILASMWIGMLANKAMQSGTFMKGFFLGNRGLGAWALALTATVQSGGTFMGFPSLVYTHGWVVALWICGYMVVPITGFGILGKRLAQLSRATGAITVPDLFRARFSSPTLGLVASLLIMFYMSFMMVAQFKAGALVMKIAWPTTGTLSLSEDKFEYQLSGPNAQALVDQNVPQEIVTRLEGLVGVGFETDAAFKAELAKSLTPEEFKIFQGPIVAAAQLTDWAYLIGLGVFTVTVVGYTLLGGFLAAVWTDLFQSVMMLVGVAILLLLALNAAAKIENTALSTAQSGSVQAQTIPPVSAIEKATRVAMQHTGPRFAFGPGYDPVGEGRQYLPLGLAFSFFWVWVFSGLGSPAGMVRVMAGKSTEVIRKSIYLLSGYNALIYLPLVMICICGRALIPDLPPGKTDQIVPQLALLVTDGIPGGSFLAGLILAAPFGAVMATVSSYLVVIASGLVRDVYQRFINPQAGSHDLRRLSYIVMITVGAIAIAANIYPVAYLQVIVVFSGTGAAATFCVPALMLAFWRRSTVTGMLASMLTGAGTMILLYLLGSYGFGSDVLIGPVSKFRPYYLLGIDPLIWGLLTSLISGITVSLTTKPPQEELLSRLFDGQPRTNPVAS